MNENHDPANGQFSDGGGGGASPRDLASRAKGALKNVQAKLKSAHAKMDKIRDKIHGTRAYQELAVKDRFTKLVPPGSKRDEFVKQSAMFAKAGLEKMAVIGAGGGPIAVGAVTAAAYASWGKHMAKQYGPRLAATSIGKRLSSMRDKVTKSLKMKLKMH